MLTRKLRLAAPALTLVAFTAAGCATSADGPVAAPSGEQRPTARVEVSQARTFGSVQDLAEFVPAIALVEIKGDGREEPADAAGVGPVKASIFQAEVIKVLKGTLPKTIPVRLITAAEGDAAPPLADGGRYVLYLQPFEFTAGKPTGEWTVPGGSGIYRSDAAGLTLISRNEGDKLPARLTSVAQANP